MAKYLVQDTSLIAIADAIREKTGSTDALVFPNGMVDAISGISGGGDVGFKTTSNGAYNDGASALVTFCVNYSATASGALTE